MKFFMLALAFVLASFSAAAAEKLAKPDYVVLSPSSATLYFKGSVKVENGKASIAIPWEASAFNVSVVNTPILSESYETCDIESDDGYDKKIRANISERNRLTARIKAIESELSLWNSLPAQIGLDELRYRLNTGPAQIEKLMLEKADIENRLQQIVPLNAKPLMRGKKMILDVPIHNSSISVSYSYVLDDCGWEPCYSFTADDDLVTVSLKAKIRQFSGTDWENADVLVSTGGEGVVAPRKLPVWRLFLPKKSMEVSIPKLMSDNVKVARNRKHVAGAKAENIATSYDVSAPVARTDDLFASWLLEKRNIPQGEITIELANDQWKSSLYRLARPGISGTAPFFVMASHEISGDKVWPSGNAEYNIRHDNGNIQNVGQGFFKNDTGKVVLNFGIDPRVSLKVMEDKKERGEKGIISVDDTWTWKFVYTIENAHEKAVKVMVERPLAIVENENISVKYNDNPKAVQNKREKALVWEMEVPEKGSKEISHETIITLPQNDDAEGFNPVMPN